MTVLDAFAWVLVAPVALADLVILVEIGLGLLPTGVRRDAVMPTPRVALLVPAHNEVATLERYGAQLAALAAPRRRVLMIADNCTDATAAKAGTLGIEVIERTDATRRGKGFALAFGRDQLALDPPEVVLCLDADCLANLEAIDLLATQARARDRPVQAVYLFRPALDAAPTVQISNFAFAIKNRVRQRGGQRIGAAATLTGSGMAFPWSLFATLDLATGNVVEDLALGIDLIERRRAPIFEDRAVVWSDSAGEGGTVVQRSRWEGGFIATAWQFAGQLIGAGIAGRDWKRLWMGLHLLVPPLALLLAANVGVAVLVAALGLLGAQLWPTAMLVGLLAAIALALIGAWWVEGYRHVRPTVLLRLPWYVLWKLAMLLRIARGKQRVAWLRTERSDP